MTQDLNLRFLKIQDNKIYFTVEKFTIAVDGYAYNGGKHEIANPQTANAQFMCCGAKYIVDNTDGVPTVEDWYTHELLPKAQMLSMLLA